MRVGALFAVAGVALTVWFCVWIAVGVGLTAWPGAKPVIYLCCAAAVPLIAVAVMWRHPWRNGAVAATFAAGLYVGAFLADHGPPTVHELHVELHRIGSPAGWQPLGEQDNGITFCLDSCPALSQTWVEPQAGPDAVTTLAKLLRRRGYKVTVNTTHNDLDAYRSRFHVRTDIVQPPARGNITITVE